MLNESQLQGDAESLKQAHGFHKVELKAQEVESVLQLVEQGKQPDEILSGLDVRKQEVLLARLIDMASGKYVSIEDALNKGEKTVTTETGTSLPAEFAQAQGQLKAWAERAFSALFEDITDESRKETAAMANVANKMREGQRYPFIMRPENPYSARKHAKLLGQAESDHETSGASGKEDEVADDSRKTQ